MIAIIAFMTTTMIQQKTRVFTYIPGTEWYNCITCYTWYVSGTKRSNSRDVEANMLTIAGCSRNCRKYVNIRDTITGIPINILVTRTKYKYYIF